MGKVIDNKYFEASVQDNLAIVSLKSEAFELITSITESQVMMDFIRDAEHDPAVRGLLLLNRPDCLGEQAYDRFIRSILAEDESLDKKDVPTFLEKNVRFRQINILNRFIRFLAGYHKLVIAGIGCTIVTPFMGVAMVADIRLASPYGSFSLAHRKYGLHPSGGIPFFLTHYLGHSKALELQLSDRITAEEAFRFGLVNQILPADHFPENCARYVQSYLNHYRSTLSTTKRLNNFKNRWLEEYQKHEGSLINL
ncbi:MAG: enoyl-CoA hydratase/isomerase family protein [Bacteroidales bacterium]|jgi:enoyl-CoA hydratase/carnithine racemase|nr:enoyl-CoA hydratase/isomerase family protein [Bacteroidales bacterium]